MTQKTINFFLNEFYSKATKTIMLRTDVFLIDEIWSLDILDPKDNSQQNKSFYRIVLVVIDDFSKFGGKFPLKKMLKQ